MRDQSGFTLIELLVVISVTAIFASAAMPNMISWINDAKVSKAGRQVFSAIQDARIHSIKVNSITNIEFSENGKTYETIKWNPETENWKTETHSLPAGVEMTAAFGSGRILSFNGRGLTASMGNVVITNNIGKTILITVSINGSPRIADSGTDS